MRLCDFCEKIRLKKDIIYEDDEFAAILNRRAAIPGHILVMPKKHFTIIEQVPDELIEKTMVLVNKFSRLLFKKLDAKGTNIIIRNGLDAGQEIPHFCVHIIPRYEDDGLRLDWQSQQIEPNRMNKYQMKIHQYLKYISEDDKEPKTKTRIQVNYLMKSLTRRP